VHLDLTFLTPGLAHQGDTLETQSLGGSETASVCLSRALARLGHHVQVFTTTNRPGNYDGVRYRPLDDFVKYATQAPHDVTIIQRTARPFSARMNSRLTVLWCHDLALGRQADEFRAALWNVDKITVLSDFMAQQYQQTYRLPEDADVLWRTRNGIDLDDFLVDVDAGISGLPPTARTWKHMADDGRTRDRFELVYGARWERGLDVLLDKILPALIAKEPRIHLTIAGYDNKVPHLSALYGQIQASIARFGQRITVLPPLTKRAYYARLASAGVYAYPTPSPANPAFAEISCITAMECQAAGLPIVSSARGALPETIAEGAGLLIGGAPLSTEYVEQFVDAVLGYVQHDGLFAAASDRGRRHAAKLDWRSVAEQWSEDLERFIVERNENPTRLVRHFIRRSDIMAARGMLEQVPAGAERDELETTISAWDFATTPDATREQYENIGRTHTDVFRQVPDETRFQMLEEWLRARPELHHILDYGCAHGGYAINLANRVGRDWVGIDIDRYSINWALRNRDSRLANPEATMDFRVGTSATMDLSDVPPFEAILAMEVLEHVPDPATVINQIERWAKADATVLLTVPFGPWEWMSYRTYPHRCHLWEFDLHDLRDLFGKKKDLKISVIPAGLCEPLGEPVGWHLVEYKVDGTPCGPIDMERKRRLQRPRQTISGVMIAGPGVEATLGWSLEGARDLVDEIVIGDCGMSELAKTIAATYGAKIVPASDPLKHGFETPRNEVLAHVSPASDWALMWDTDERIVGASNVNKYMRANLFNGYQVRQHNFACDNRNETVIPVRCFRLTPRAKDGKRLKFFGMIHEHPEYGINEGPGLVITWRDVNIAHLGYLTGEDQMQRFQRNAPLLRRDLEVYPDRKLQKHFLCRDHMSLAKWAFVGAGERMTAEVEAHCRVVVELYREHFLGQSNLMAIDTLQYYSQALALLGEGVTVTWSLTAGKDGNVEPGEPARARFADFEEAKREFDWRLRDAMAPFGEYW
jgi:glycosyltransferase involved in cell wall biosynthesis/SAM-dependent methyltransferase